MVRLWQIGDDAVERNFGTHEKRKISKVKILTLVMVFILFCTGTAGQSLLTSKNLILDLTIWKISLGSMRKDKIEIFPVSHVTHTSEREMTDTGLDSNLGFVKVIGSLWTQ